MVEISEIKEEEIASYVSEWEKRKYVPKPGEPALPPQLSGVTDKSIDEVVNELNRLPLFMTELDETDGDGGENTQVEALRALAYEGEPHEIATNFKNQGNDCYKGKQYKDAVSFYTKGLDVKCDVNDINASLFLNRAACNLELKNYRRCINDCKECLKLQPRNVKALFRSAKAYFAIEKYDEAEQVLDYAMKIDDKNAAVNGLLKTIEAKKYSIAQAKEKAQKIAEEKERTLKVLDIAIKTRGMSLVKTSRPAELLKENKLHLEDKDDIESQLIFPAMILYPTTDEFDFVAEISELTTPLELMELVLDRPESFFKDPKHENFRPKKLEAYMETLSGGLIKVGKKAAINTALMSSSPKVPLFDKALKIMFVPKVDAAEWIKTWNKEQALEKRQQ